MLQRPAVMQDLDSGVMGNAAVKMPSLHAIACFQPR